MNAMLKSGSLKRKIVQKINAMIDIPWLDETMEAKVIGMAVDACFSALGGSGGSGSRSAELGDGFDPDAIDLDEELPSEGDPSTDEASKEAMVDKINKQFDIPGMDEEKEAKLIRSFVDALFSCRGEASN